MPQMIVKELREYAGRQLKVGETFEAEDGHVTVLTLMGLAEVAEGQPADHGAAGTVPAAVGSFLRRKVLTTGKLR